MGILWEIVSAHFHDFFVREKNILKMNGNTEIDFHSNFTIIIRLRAEIVFRPKGCSRFKRPNVSVERFLLILSRN